MSKPSEAVKRAFEIGVRAREFVIAERAALNERSGLDVRSSMSPCPICGGHLRWVIMPNEHIHMSCLTENCVQWIE